MQAVKGTEQCIVLRALCVSLVCHVQLNGTSFWWLLRESDATVQGAKDTLDAEDASADGSGTKVPGRGYIILTVDGMSLAPFHDVLYSRWCRKTFDLVVEHMWPVFSDFPRGARWGSGANNLELSVWASKATDVFCVALEGGWSSSQPCKCDERKICCDCKAVACGEKLFSDQDQEEGVDARGEYIWWTA
jgi:hypothetical protein